MSMLEKIMDCYEDMEFLKADGFDDAVVGMEPGTFRLVYSVEKAMDILRQTMSDDEAREHFYFNVIDCHMGEQTPIWMDDEF